MGLGPSKEKIKRLLEKSCNDNKNITEQSNNLKIGYYRSNPTDIRISFDNSFSSHTDVSTSFNESQSFIDVSSMEGQTITSDNSIVQNKQFPYSCVKSIMVSFDNGNVYEYFTGFIIDTNAIVTLASNVIKNGKKGLVKTCFSDKPVKSIFTPLDFKKEQNENNKKKNKDDNIKNDNNSPFYPNLAVIAYEDNIVDEWIGVESLSLDDLSPKDLNLICSLGLKNENIHKEINGNDSNSSSIMNISNSSNNSENSSVKLNNACEIHEQNVTTTTRFDEDLEVEEQKKLKKCLGGPVYYKDYDQGAFVVGILDLKQEEDGDTYSLTFFDNKCLNFLVDCVNKAKLLRKKNHKNIDEEHIIKLDLSRNDFGPLDVKYLTDFDLKNLRYLDLSSNSIKPQGAFYLSQGKYPNLELLNLNFNEIGDEGLNHIANGNFTKLTNLFLFHNNISDKGIQYLCKADFISNLIILSLSENPNIGDTGIRIIKENTNWGKLTTLNLNGTGLTDVAVGYLTNSSMPSLKRLNIIGNKFSSKIVFSISSLKLNHIKVEYMSPEEKKRNHNLKKKGEYLKKGEEEENLKKDESSIVVD
jgi:hypothetical protein